MTKDVAVAAAAEADRFAAIKTRQRAMWDSGDYSIIGTTLQIVGEQLCEAADIHAGERVLDVAAGNGNATLAAARRFARVTSTDYVPALLDRGRRRAEAEGLNVHFEVADVEALPYAPDSFDAVLSTFGVMFAPNQEQAAREMLRVVKRGGRVAVANWTPGGFIGRLFQVLSTYVAPPPGVQSPLLWGTPTHLQSLFTGASAIEHTRRSFAFRYESPEHWLHMFRTWYGPVHKAFASLEPSRQVALEGEIIGLLRRANRGGLAGLVVPSEYLETVITR